MSENKEPSSGSPESPLFDEGVISLCARRRRRRTRSLTKELLERLSTVHTRAIQEHNQAIARAGLSVLTELCKALELCLDQIEPILRAALVIPAALYGADQDQIFGKRALQHQIALALKDDPSALAIFEALNDAQPTLWEVQVRPDEATHLARALRGSPHDEPIELAAVIVESGACALTSGVYCGWKIRFQEMDFIVFGYRLDRRRRDALRASTPAQRSSILSTDKALDLELLRRIIDPQGINRQPNLSLRSNSSGLGLGRSMSRRGMVLAMRRALWRHFAEPKSGLTIHAHIAALIDDDDARQAFFDEIQEVISHITLSSGGLPACQAPITIDEILAPFSLTGTGELLHRLDLGPLPLDLLLLKPQILTDVSLDPGASIDEARVAFAAQKNSAQAQAFEAAFFTFRTEQNLVATYGVAPGGQASERAGTIAFARRSLVLPNIKTLFDPRFLTHTLADLALPDDAVQSLERGLDATGDTLDSFTLDQMGPDERHLICLPHVSHKTCNALRVALLELAASWRWVRSGRAMP